MNKWNLCNDYVLFISTSFTIFCRDTVKDFHMEGRQSQSLPFSSNFMDLTDPEEAAWETTSLHEHLCCFSKGRQLQACTHQKQQRPEIVTVLLQEGASLTEIVATIYRLDQVWLLLSAVNLLLHKPFWKSWYIMQFCTMLLFQDNSARKKIDLKFNPWSLNSNLWNIFYRDWETIIHY